MRLVASLAMFLVVRALGADCSFPGEPQGAGAYRLDAWASGLERPVQMVPVPGRSLFWVVEQSGRLRAIAESGASQGYVLDIRDRVTVLGGANDERGLLGIALHPRFETNRRLFLNYTTRPPLRTRISELSMSADGSVDPASERVILEITQPFGNHNGGALAFGPDGYLYVGTGDGGSGGDPHGYAQNTASLLGKMLRIDVNGQRPYAIPEDNPLWPGQGARREIFAIGLRNPWRFSFDTVTGKLWAGDVGQGKWEEIDVIEKGKNYGWNPVEGTSCYVDPDCDIAAYDPPVHVYGRDEGYSVTGGLVYRGSKFPELVGTYLFGDFGSGAIWGIPVDGGAARRMASGSQVSAFASDLDGNQVFVLSLSGSIARLERDQSRSAGFPLRLSETGCFSSLSPLVPSPALVPYDVNSPLWSDGADKDRYLYLPPGRKIRFRATSAWEFPAGAVLVKHFSAETWESGAPRRRHLETRFLVKREAGFAYYTYRWNDAETEAMWIGGAQKRRLELHESGEGVPYEYHYPSPVECRACHTTAAGEALGVSTAQMNHAEAGGGNQLDRLSSRGAFAAGSYPGTESLPFLVDYRAISHPPGLRARSFLHSQCAHCHRPDNPSAQSPMDLRHDTSLSAMRICDVVPGHGDLGIGDARLLAPGDPDRSVLWARAARLDPRYRMPPLSTSRLDQAGLGALRDWIAGVACP